MRQIRLLQRVPWCLIALGLLSGCATVNPEHDYEQTAGHIENATGQAAIYSPKREKIAEQRIETLLQGGLSVDEAVQVCLLNNPSLRALFMDVGMARADVVQSGLFTNPSLNLALQLPAGGGLANLQGGIAANIADLWQIPIRKKVARRVLEQTILDIAKQAADLAYDARATYYTTVGARKLHDIARENLGIAKELLDLVVARQKAGAGNAIDVNLANSQVAEAELIRESTRLGVAARLARKRLRAGDLGKSECTAVEDSPPLRPRPV